MAAARRTPPPPLTVDQILALKTELETQYSDEDTQIRDMRAVRMQTDKVAEGMTRYTDVIARDPTITDQVADSVAALSTNPASVTCIYKPGGSDPDEHNTTLRDAFYTELIEDMCTRIEGQNARTDGIDMSMGDGGTWTKVLFAKDLWEEAGAIRRKGQDQYGNPLKLKDEKGKFRTETGPEYDSSTEQAKKDAGQPFVAIAIDPLSFYPIRSGTKLVGGMEVQKRPLNQTLLQYNLQMDPSGDISAMPEVVGEPQNKWDAQKRQGTVDYIEYWDEWRCYIVLQGANHTGYLVDPWLHGYGRPPYFPAFGFKMGHWKNRKVGWGIAQSKRWLVQYSSFLKTLLADVVARDTYTPWKHRLGPQSSQMAQLQVKEGKPDFTEDWKIELREVIKLYDGDDLGPLETRDIAPALKEAIIQNRADIIASMPPKLTSSSGGGMEGAGYAMSQVREEAHQKYHPYIQNLEQMWSDILDFIDWLIVNKVKGKVWIHAAPIDESEYPRTGRQPRQGGWISIGPDDITNFPVKKKVSIDPDQATAKLVEGQYWTQQNIAGMADKDTAIRAQGRNPDLVRQGLAKDRIRASDWYRNYEDKIVTQSMGLGNLLQTSKLAQMVAQTGALPGQQPAQPAAPPGPQAGPMQDPTALATSGGGQQPDMARGMVAGGTTVPTPTAGAAVGVPPSAV